MKVTIRSGVCHLLFAYDIGMAIDLVKCRKAISSLGGSETLSIRNRRAPEYFGFDPPPLTMVQVSSPSPVGSYVVSTQVLLTFYDFGALSIGYAIDFSGDLESMRELSIAVQRNDSFRSDSRRRAEDMMRRLGDAIDSPFVAAPVEDYLIFEVKDFEASCPIGELPERAGAGLAQILRAEHQALSGQETADSLACRISYSMNDLALIDWNAAIIFDRDAEDVRAVLEFANVELLELRFLDFQLDASLDRSFELALRPRRITKWLPGRSARKSEQISRMQLEGAILFERVSNAPKLLGDQFLARVYRLAAQRFHVGEWNDGILRKLETLEDFYQQLHGKAAGRRLELLEWIIIVLIFVEIVLPLLIRKFPVL